MPEPRPTTEYTAEQMRRMLGVGAEQVDRYPVYAAVHLLTFTELPGRAGFADLVDVRDVNAGAGFPILAAFVRDWTTLPTAAAELYTVTPTPALAALLARRDGGTGGVR